MQTLLCTMFEYKAWANHELLMALEALTQEKHPRQLHEAKRILNHVYVVDKIFEANLQRKLHPYNALNTSDTPLLAALRAQVAQLDAWFIQYVSTLSDSDLAEEINFLFVDGTPGCMKRGEMLLHLLTHGNYHRGAVGRILTEIQITPPKDSLTVFLHSKA